MVANLQQQLIPGEVRELIAQQRFCIDGLSDIARHLPDDDAALHGWLEEAIAQQDQLAFNQLIYAAALVGRKLRASLLVQGTMLLNNQYTFGVIAWQMEGDVTGCLLEALRGPAFRGDVRAMALFVAAAWWQKHGEGAVPGEILTGARTMARQTDKSTRSTLAALQVLTGNEELKRIVLPFRPSADIMQKAAWVKDSLLETLERKQFAELVPAEEAHYIQSNRTIRRAVEKVGRNELCHCGSGRKNKKCCVGKDRDRLRLSTDVAGKTYAELQENPVAYLTPERLERSLPAELMRMDPLEVPPEAREMFLFRLTAFSCFDALVTAFERLGVTEELESIWKRIFLFVIKEWKPEIARRLVALHPQGEAILPQLYAGVRLLLASGSAEEFLRTAEAEAMAALQTNDEEVRQELAMALLSSPYPAVGIFVARSLLPLANETNAQFLFDEILGARDRLGLSPEDELSDFMDERALRSDRGNESAAIQEAQDKLAAKGEEARRNKEEAARLDRELKLLRREARRVESETKSVATPDEAAQRRIRELKEEMKRLQLKTAEDANERLALRRDVQAKTAENEALKAASREKEPNETDDGEVFDASGTQPVRLIEFPKEFAETLASFPRHVGRATMNRLGRIASGEPGAFERVKQLKAYPEVLRARVSDKHRLLFCLTPHRVRVVDLIRRADLDRRIERLQASGLPPVG